MNAMNTINALREAWGSSSRSNNRFSSCLNRINWDSVFEGGEDTLYINGNLYLTVFSDDPFADAPCPVAVFCEQGITYRCPIGGLDLNITRLS